MLQHLIAAQARRFRPKSARRNRKRSCRTQRERRRQQRACWLRAFERRRQGIHVFASRVCTRTRTTPTSLTSQRALPTDLSPVCLPSAAQSCPQQATEGRLTCAPAEQTVTRYLLNENRYALLAAVCHSCSHPASRCTPAQFHRHILHTTHSHHQHCLQPTARPQPRQTQTQPAADAAPQTTPASHRPKAATRCSC